MLYFLGVGRFGRYHVIDLRDIEHKAVISKRVMLGLIQCPRFFAKQK